MRGRFHVETPMPEPIFGLSITPVDNETRSASPADMSVIGLICTAPDADVDVFPLNTPVTFSSDDAAAILALGATGEAATAVAEIDANTGSVSARIIFVRVDAGANVAEAMTNIVGNAGSKTGLHAFKEAPGLLGLTPRLIVVPGYTGIVQRGISASIGAQGTGGANGTFALAFSGGAGTGAAGTFTVAAGKLTSFVITNPGVYTSAPTAVLTASAGLTTATLTLTLVDQANPVCAALGGVLDDLKAVAFASGPNSTSTAAKAWRANLNHKRLIPIDNGHKIQQDADTIATIDPALAAVGLQIQVDAENAGVPSGIVANRAVQGIIDVSRNIRFSLTDGSVDGQDLLAHQIGITVRGSTADGALSDSGFVMVVLDNAGDDTLWRQYHEVRVRDYIDLMLVRTTRFYLGRFKLTGQTIQSVLNTMNSFLRDLQVGGHILGAQVGFDSDDNSVESLRAGEFKVFYKAEEAPILRKLGVKTYRYAAALEALLTQIAA
jgi:phage tail sheath protein FI